jgi:hypothetical protein
MGTDARGYIEIMSSVVQSLDFATRALESEMGQLSKSIFFFGDGLQRATVDGWFDLLKPRTWRPANLLRLGWSAARVPVELSRFVVPGEAGPAWEELRNKLEVFLLVSELPAILGVDPKTWAPLPDLVDKAYSLSAFPALWAVEGVGHYYADAYWEQNGQPHGLLLPDSAPVPEKSLLMLHAGIGLSFADRLLDTVTHESPAHEIHHVVEQFVNLCRDNSREGYLGPAVESLGLVTRDFYPDMVAVIDEQLQAIAPGLRGYFWHGVGRALYFSRAYFLPILRTAWGSIDQEAEDRFGQNNVMAGLAWAVTVVNMRQPEIMEGVLRSYIEHSDLAAAFSDGVSSSIVMREDTTPGEAFVKAFYEHEAASGNRNLITTWNKRVSGPAKVALRTYYPVLKQHRRLEDVFQYQPLGSLADRLDAETTAPAAASVE